MDDIASPCSARAVRMFKMRFEEVQLKAEKQDFELWNLDPNRYVRMLEATRFNLPFWARHHLAIQAAELISSFGTWLVNLRVDPPEPADLMEYMQASPFRHGALGIKAPALVDRMQDVDIDKTILGLTIEFQSSVKPYAKALGVPAEAVLWCSMLHFDAMAKDFDFADALRAVLRASEIWERHGRIRFETDDELEAFRLEVFLERSRELDDLEWGEEANSVLEYRIMQRFCQFVHLVGGSTDFGKAMAHGPYKAPDPNDFEEFYQYALHAAARFRVIETVHIDRQRFRQRADDRR